MQANVMHARSRSTLMETTARMWSELLAVEHVGPDDDFFKLGGDSLQATRLVRRVESELQVTLDPLEIFGAPVLRDFAALLASATATSPQGQPAKTGRNPKLLTPLVVQPRPARIPISCSQKAWCDLEPIYRLEQRISLVRRLRGPLNIANMQQAIARLKASHEILRTCYTVIDGALCQVIAPAEDERLSVEDLTHLPLAARNRRVWEMLHEIYRSELRLDQPALDLRLFRMDQDDYYLAGFISHLAFDAASVGVFWKELFQSYRAETFGTPVAAPTSQVQFADFALWENALLTQEQLALSESFWSERMAAAQPLQLPNAPHPLDTPSRWGVVPIGFPDSQFAAAARFAAQKGVTLPIVLLGAAATVLARWTHQDRVVLGNVINGRPPAMAEAIGCFIQMRPFHIDISADPTFAELLALSRLAYIEANNLSMPPPRKLLERLQLARFMVNVTSGDDEKPGDAEEGLGFVVTRRSLPNPLKTEVSRDVSLTLSCGSGSLGGWIVYAADRFKHGEIHGLAQNVVSLLARGIESPDSRLSVLLPVGGE